MLKRISKKFRDQSGFTLLELIVSLAIFVVILAGIYAFLMTSTRISKSINDNARRENELITTVETVRSKLSNAFDVQMVPYSELSSPESGYTYLFCGPDGGISMMKDGARSDMYGINSLRTEKIMITFSGKDAIASGGYSGLTYDVKLYPIGIDEDASDSSNLLLNDTGIFDSAMQTYFTGRAYLGQNPRDTVYSDRVVMSFQNCDVVQDKLNHSVDGVLARVVKFKDPATVDALSLAPTLGTTTTTTTVTTTSGTEPTSNAATSATVTTDTPTQTTTQSLDGSLSVSHQIDYSDSTQIRYLILIHNQTGSSKPWTDTIDIPGSATISGTSDCGHNVTIDHANHRVVVQSRINAESGFDDTKVWLTVNLAAAVKKITVYPHLTNNGSTITGTIEIKNEGTVAVSGEPWSYTVVTGGTVASYSGHYAVDGSKASVNVSQSGNDLVYSGNVNLGVGDSTEINIGTINLSSAQLGKVTVHFDNVNLVTKNGRQIVGFYNQSTARFINNYVTTDYTFDLQSTSVIMLNGVYAGGGDAGSILTQLSYQQVMAQSITDVYIVGTSVSYTKPANFRVAASAPSITVNVNYDSSGESEFGFINGEAVSGVYYLRKPEAHYNNWNYTQGTSFSLEQGETVEIVLRSTWSRSLATATYSYDDLNGKTICIKGSSVWLQ